MPRVTSAGHNFVKFENVLPGLFYAFVFLCFMGGGGSRADIASLLYLRPAAICIIAIFALQFRASQFGRVRMPATLLLALACAMVLQLIPLPPPIWLALPGHAFLAEAAGAANIPQPWRPITLTPDATLNSLMSLCVPMAALIGACSIGRARQGALLNVLIIGGGVSACVGVLQLALGPDSFLYLYRVTNDGVPVGLFANRNHQAILLSCMFPMLATWASLPHLKSDQRRLRGIVALCAALAILPLLVITGSRAGLVLSLIGVAAALWLYFSANTRFTLSRRTWAIVIGSTLAAMALLIWLGAAYSKINAIDRAFYMSVGDDTRYTSLSTLLTMAKDYFPFGSGFGSFEFIYTKYEPVSSLDSTYLNHAHNDLVELVITGGIAGLLISFTFLMWLLAKAFATIKMRATRADDGFAALGAVLIVIVLAGSMADYPLRTPLIATFFAVACCWLSIASDVDRGAPEGHRAKLDAGESRTF
jgi:O-antigen ligase